MSHERAFNNVLICGLTSVSRPGGAMSWSQKVADVLRVVVETCEDVTDVKLVCTLLQVSTECRAALQQARGHCAAKFHMVEFDDGVAELMGDLNRLYAFAAWLPGHAGLVSRLCACDYTSVVATDAVGLHIATAISSAVVAALLLCARPKAAPPAAAAAGVPRLHLQEVTTSAVVTPALLRALAGVEVENLFLFMRDDEASPAVCAAFSGLTSLKGLHVRERGSLGGTTSRVQALQHLSSLTRLALSLPAAATPLLPTSLKVVDLHVWAPERATADLHHLTALTSLCLSVEGGSGRRRDHITLSVLLPQSACLAELSVTGNMRLSGVGTVGTVRICPSVPAHLAVLQDLCSVKDPWDMDLKLPPARNPASIAALEQAAAALACSSHLTSLTMSAGSVVTVHPAWCSAIAALPQLLRLVIGGRTLPPQEVLKLTVVTRLEVLLLDVKGVDDHAAVSLLSRLIRLERLRMKCSSIKTVALLACLPSMTQLCLWDWGDVTMQDHHLQHLLPLRRLRELRLPLLKHCSEQGISMLREALPQLTKLVLDS